jgi:hypothetical protein
MELLGKASLPGELISIAEHGDIGKVVIVIVA